MLRNWEQIDDVRDELASTKRLIEDTRELINKYECHNKKYSSNHVATAAGHVNEAKQWLIDNKNFIEDRLETLLKID